MEQFALLQCYTMSSQGNQERRVGVWSTEEHERYLQAKYANPKASWKEIALLVGTRSARQVILHDQKFRMKMERRRTKGELPLPSVATAALDAAHGGDNQEMRYIDSMGVLLLASVASTRMTKIGDDQESSQRIEEGKQVG